MYVTQWQDSQADYPLANAGGLSGIFSDASFVQYDNFVPILNTINITGTNLVLAFTFDNGVQTFSIPLTSIYSSYAYRLRVAERTHGTITFGRAASNLVNGMLGTAIVANVLFLNSTVFSIDSTQAVYSVNGLRGAVTVELDDNLWFSDNGIYAASVPSNISVINTVDSNYYFNTSTLQVIEINPASTNTVLGALDKAYTTICNTGAYLVAVLAGSSSNIYNLSSVPATKLTTVNYSVTSVTVDGSGNLWGIAGNNLVNFGAYPYTSTPVVVNLGFTPIGVTYVNGAFMTFVNGPADYANPGLYFSSMFYSISVSGTTATSTLVGIMADASNNHLPWLTSITVINGFLYGVCYKTGEGYQIYQIDPSILTSTLVSTYAGDGTTGTVLSVFIGGQEISSTPIVPLKTINGLAVDAFNNISIVGTTTVSITPSSNNTLTFSLPVPDAQLNVARTTVYE